MEAAQASQGKPVDASEVAAAPPAQEAAAAGVKGKAKRSRSATPAEGAAAKKARA